MSADDERTPLLRPDNAGASVAVASADDDRGGTQTSRSRSCLHAVFHVENRILLAGFLISLSFSFTQVPYV